MRDTVYFTLPIGGLSNTNEQARIEVFQAILDKQIIRPDTV